VILRLWIPTWLLLPFVVPGWRASLRLRDPRVWMPLIWVALVLVFFSIPSGKRAIYILPALPMLALAMAPEVAGLLKTRWLPRAAFWITAGCAIVFVGAGAWALSKAPRAAQRIAEGYELSGHGEPLWWCVVAVGLGFLVAAAVFRPRRGVAALLAGMGLAWIIWPVATYPLLDANQSTRQLMEEADQHVGPDGQLGLVLWREELMYQARRPVAEFGFVRDASDQLRDGRAWQAADPAHRWLLINEEALDDCIVREKVVPLGVANRTKFALLPADASKPGCVSTAPKP